MADKTYLNLDALIERSDEGYKIRVLHSPAGSAQGIFSAPFSSLEIENLILRIGRPRQGMRRLESPDMESIKIFGGQLFNAVFQGEVESCLRSSLDQANRQGVGLRLRLQFADVPDLVNLPWEFLYNPTVNRFLALSAETPIIRYLNLPEPVKPLALNPPLRVLAMISSPSDYPPLDVEKEWANLKETLAPLERTGKVLVDRLENPTLSALLPRIREYEYHIFHFIGHGGFDQQAQDGVLLLEGENQRGRAVSGQELGMLLHDERTLRLAVLNACEGGHASSTDPFAGVALSLVQQRIPAVIAMQFEISDEAAISFSRGFYGALADGFPVDAALAEARRAIFAQGNALEWGTPVLFTCVEESQIFDIQGEEAEASLPGKEELPTPVTASDEGEKQPPIPAAPSIRFPRWLLPLTGGAILLVLLGIFLFSIGKKPFVETPASATIPSTSTALAVETISIPTTSVSNVVLVPSDTPQPHPVSSETPTLEPTSEPTFDPTPTFAPGRDIASNCISKNIWISQPRIFQTEEECLDLSSRGIYTKDGQLVFDAPVPGASSSVSDTEYVGIYSKIPSNVDINFKVRITQLESTYKGVLMFGITPIIPTDLMKNDFLIYPSLLLFQIEGPNQPIVMKLKDEYLQEPDGRYRIYTKGTDRKVIIQFESRQMTVWIDGTPVDINPPRMAPSEQYYFWIGYRLRGNYETMILQSSISDLTFQEP